jgi:nucleoside-diphosphate-sugar epimerase
VAHRSHFLSPRNIAGLFDSAARTALQDRAHGVISSLESLGEDMDAPIENTENHSAIPAQSQTAEQSQAAEQAQAAGEAPPRKIALLGEMRFAGKAVARAMLEKGMAVRALCPDEATELAVRGAVPADAGERLEIVSGSLDSLEAMRGLLDGAYGAAFISPISLNGRIHRAKEHVEDVKRLAKAAEGAALRKLVYHSSLSAHPEAAAQCLRDAALAEGYIKEARCEDFVIRTPPLMGQEDGLVHAAFKSMRVGAPFMSIWGYGATEMNPLHVDDFGRCMLRVFSDEGGELRPSVYLIIGPEKTTPMDLYDAAAEKLGVFKFKLHLPLFILKLFASARGADFTERLELLFELDDARRAPPARFDNDMLFGRGARLKTVAQTSEQIVALAR